ncbi:MAG: hypothetical protein ACYC3L_06750 [Gemmatimonadaceae bacterium]
MTWTRWPYRARMAALLVLAMMMPLVRHLLEATMSAQMLVQIPLLVAAGWLLAGAVPARVLAGVDAWNHRGIAGLVLVTVVSAFWMLPRSLDAATTHPLMTAAKYVSVPLLIGVPLAVSWPRTGFVVRGIFLMEVVATFFRLGWLYLISPIRLCNNYALNDQQRLGRYMLVTGGGLLIWLAWKLVWGRFESFSNTDVRATASLPPRAPVNGAKR